MSLNFHSETFPQLKYFFPIRSVTHFHCITITNDDGHKNEDGDDILRWRGALCNVLQFIVCSINTIHRPGDYLQFGTVMNNATTKILTHIF